MSTVLISEDIGYLYNKAIVNNIPHMFKSIVGNGKELSLTDLNLSDKQETDHIVCRHEDEIYFVSDLAIKESDTVFYSLKEDRFQELALDVIIKCTMGIGLSSGFHDTYIVSGLPLQQYKKFKDNISSLFMPGGTTVHEFDITANGIDCRGGVRIVDGRFIPQPFGVVLNEVLNDSGTIEDKDLAKKTVAVIDVGFGTTDVYVCSALEPVEKLSFSSLTAMNTAYKLIAGKILESWEVEEPLYRIENVVKTGKYKYNGNSYDMSKVIQWSMNSVSNTLLSELFTKWRSTNTIDSIILAGGGGLRLSPFMIKEFSNMRMTKDGQWSVAKGYRKWGVRTWKDVI